MLRSLPAKFNPKASTIEEMSNIVTLAMDKLLGSPTSYEIKTTEGKSTSREADFNADRKSTEYQECSSSCSDEEETKFLRRLEKGTSKYKGKLHFNALILEEYAIMLQNVHSKRKRKSKEVKKKEL